MSLNPITRRGQGRVLEALLASLMLVIVITPLLGSARPASYTSNREVHYLNAVSALKVIVFDGVLDDAISTGSTARLKLVLKAMLGDGCWRLEVINVTSGVKIVDLGTPVAEVKVRVSMLLPGYCGSLDPLNVTLTIGESP